MENMISQFGSVYSQYDGKVIKFHGSSHHQPVIVVHFLLQRRPVFVAPGLQLSLRTRQLNRALCCDTPRDYGPQICWTLTMLALATEKLPADGSKELVFLFDLYRIYIISPSILLFFIYMMYIVPYYSI